MYFTSTPDLNSMEAIMKRPPGRNQRGGGNYTLQTLCGAPHNICNEEGKLLGMEGNRRIPGDVLAGPFFVVGDAGETFRSLTEEELERYRERFAEIEDISPQEVQAATGFFFCAM